MPRFCYTVAEDVEPSLRRILLDSSVACLVPERDIPTLADGRPLLAGMFAVPHKASTDRLIFDRRPANELEDRLQRVTLPLGPQLARTMLHKRSAVRASGDDLRTYFYRLRNAPGSEVRNCFGRRVRGEEVTRWGGVAGEYYRLGLRAVGMGDRNAVDVAHATHWEVLKKGGSCVHMRSYSMATSSPGAQSSKGYTLTTTSC